MKTIIVMTFVVCTFTNIEGKSLLCTETDESNPVCGVNGINYRNPSAARCAGTEVASFGKCETPSCLCQLSYEPVCGVNKKTYGNSCAARCAGVKIAFQGMCSCAGNDLWGRWKNALFPC